MFKTMKDFAIKYKKAIGAVIVLLSVFLTYHFSTEEEQETQKTESLENIKETIKEQVQESIEEIPDTLEDDSTKG